MASQGHDRAHLMALHGAVELTNTREKLQRLEEQYERRLREPAENAQVRKLSLRSLKRLINQLKEEIARYEAQATNHSPTSAANEVNSRTAPLNP